jgi:hypothetical protein
VRGAVESGPGQVVEQRVSGAPAGGRGPAHGVADADDQAALSVSPFRVYNDEITVTGSMAILLSFAPAVELITSGVVDRAGQGIKWHIRPS